MSNRASRIARTLALVGSIAVVGLVFALALPSIAHYGAVWKELRSLTPLWLGGLAAAVLVNGVTSALPWRVLLPRLGFLWALRITQASTALITVLPGGAPAGMALSFAMLRTRRIDRGSAALTVALSGIWSQLSTFLFPVVAVAALAAGGPLPRPAVWAAVAGIVVIAIAVVLLALALAAPRRALVLAGALRSASGVLLRVTRRRVRTWSRTGVLRLRRRTIAAIREHGVALSLATLANQLTAYLVFDLSLRAVGISTGRVTVIESFTAWSLARLIESLPLTPGGLGLVELGLTGTLVAFGAPHAPLVAAVLLYRGLVVVPTLALGAIAGLTWRVGSRTEGVPA